MFVCPLSQGVNGMRGDKGDAGLPGLQGSSVSLIYEILFDINSRSILDTVSRSLQTDIQSCVVLLL